MSEPHGVERVRQEPEAVRGRLVALVIVAAVGVTVALVAVVVLFIGVERKRLGGTSSTPRYPAGRTVGGIEQTPIDGPPHGENLETKKRAALDAYGWIDKRRGIATIPIAKAMAWLVHDAKNGTLASPDRATTDDADAGMTEQGAR